MVESVVDYAAWEKGYMPPSEHVLIDKLAYRGARVVLSTPLSKNHQVWIVMEGPPMTNKQRKMLREVMNIWFEDEPESKGGVADVGRSSENGEGEPAVTRVSGDPAAIQNG